MQFSVAKSALCGALSLAGRVVEKKTSIPILSNVKLHADTDHLTISATDLESALTVRVEASIAEPGATTLPAKRLSDYTRLLPEGDIRFRGDEKAWVTITSGRSRTRISGMSVESFPELPTVPDAALTVPAGLFLALINRTKLAITKVESRFVLDGALFDHHDGHLHLVATDGHRLAFAWSDLSGERDTKFLLPGSALRNLPQLIGGSESFAISQDDNHLFFRAGQALLAVRKLAGQFLDYRRVLPKESKVVLTVNRADLAGALSRVAQFADERSRAVRLSLKKELEIFASRADAGESSETVQCDYAGEPLEVGFNAQYLSEFLSVIDSEAVTIHLNDATSAGEFRPAGASDYRYVVMPMRI
jgi:DNA polymerase-3 subunit beta